MSPVEAHKAHLKPPPSATGRPDKHKKSKSDKDRLTPPTGESNNKKPSATLADSLQQRTLARSDTDRTLRMSTPEQVPERAAGHESSDDDLPPKKRERKCELSLLCESRSSG